MSRRPLGSILGLPRRVLSLLAHGADRLQQIARDVQRIAKVSDANARTVSQVGKRTAKVEASVAAVATDVRTLANETRLLREELRERLLQYNLQLGRLSRAAPGEADGAQRLSSRSVPLELDGAPAPGWQGVGGQPHPDPEGREWLLLDACPMCGHPDRTIVNEWNKIILMDRAPDAQSARYDFAVCHACGVTYATRRPYGGRYAFLLANFGEVTAKHGTDGSFTNPLLNPYPLSDADRQELTARAARGVFVSEHLDLRSKDYLEGLIKDRFENSVHLDVLGSLLAPYNARVLEIRPRAGTISDGLRRLFSADVCALPIWESQRYLLKEVYDIDSAGLVNYDRFEIPYGGQFDLIVCNHMLTHALRPQEFFAAVRRSLKPGGHIYFYNEPDDAEYLRGNQSMLATLNPLHMQAFDMASFVRALAANGFEVTFHRRRNVNHLSLARLTPTTFTPMREAERDRRIRLYKRARDRAILGLRGDLRSRFADEWPQLVERGVAEGLVEFDADGELRLVAR